MRSRVSWLLIGLVLFAIAAWFMSCAAFGWSSVWRSQHLLTAKRSRIVLVDPALANDPAVDAAKLTVVGPLANAIEPVENAPDAGQNATPPTPPTAFDHVERPATSKPLGFHSSFLVKTYRFFEFVVPAHTSSPRFQGTFKSFYADRGKGGATVGALLLDEQQFGEFVHGDSGTAVLSTESSAAGSIDVALNSTVFESKKYYLVFRSPDRRNRLVSAEFTATFD